MSTTELCTSTSLSRQLRMVCRLSFAKLTLTLPTADAPPEFIQALRQALDPIDRKIDNLMNDVKKLTNDMQIFKNDVNGLKDDMQSVKATQGHIRRISAIVSCNAALL